MADRNKRDSLGRDLDKAKRFEEGFRGKKTGLDKAIEKIFGSGHKEKIKGKNLIDHI